MPEDAYMRHWFKCHVLPIRRQAVAETNANSLSIIPTGTNSSEIWNKIPWFSFKKMHSKMSSAKMTAILFLPQCVAPNVEVTLHQNMAGTLPLTSWRLNKPQCPLLYHDCLFSYICLPPNALSEPVKNPSSRCPICKVKSLRLIGRSGTRRWNLRVPDLLPMRCSDLTMNVHKTAAVRRQVPYIINSLSDAYMRQ